jgi:serine/threonine protein kinase
MAKRIGKYEIQGEIGKGGFGHVYVALDPVVNRQVAIKVLISAEDPDILARFRAEAEAAGRLRHKNVVTVYDYGEVEGVPYLVMEYLEGDTLQQLMQGPRKLSLLEKISIMTQAADGLQCAHQNGIIHRDVKPSNIMVLRDGSVKIMDFGIARALQSDTTRRTRTGFLIGTMSYMCPEQFQNGTVDALCDIWAYGVIYYELVTGVHPFQAADPATLMYRINNVEPPPVLTLLPECPEALAAVLQKTLAKQRELRYQSLQDVQYDTEPILIELKRERASEMVAEARRLLELGEVDTANKMTRSIFDMDPTNRDARQLRETIQEHLQWRAVKPRVEALVRSGEESLAQRQFPEAIQLFESALRLDSGDTSLRIRIEQAQVAYEQSRRAAQLLADAQQQLKRQDLTAAHRSAAEALRADPQNPQAGQLLETINRDIDKREHRRQLEDNLATGGELLKAGDYEAAVALLIDLNLRHPRTAAVTSLLAHAQSLKAEGERKKRLRSEMDSARALLDQTRFAEAVRRLERLVSEFAQDESFISLLAAAREGLKAQERAERLRRVMKESRALLAQRNFGRAVDTLVDAVRSFPGDEELATLLREALQAKSADDRKQEILRAVRRAEELRNASRFAEALETIEGSLTEKNDVPELMELRASLLEELQKQKRNKAVTEAKAGANELLMAGRPTDALTLLANTATYHMAAEELAPLISQAKEAKRKQAEEEAIRERMQQAEALEAKGSTAEALAIFEALVREHPGKTKAVEGVQRLRGALAAQQRERMLQRRIDGIEPKLAGESWEAAMRLILAAQAEFPREARLEALATRAAEGQRRLEDARRADREKKVQGVIGAIDAKLAAEDWEAALRLSGAAQAEFPGEARLQTLAARAAEGQRRLEDARRRERDREQQRDEMSATRLLSPNVSPMQQGAVKPPETKPMVADVAPVASRPVVAPPSARAGSAVTAVERPKRTIPMALGVGAALVVLTVGTWFVLHQKKPPERHGAIVISPTALVFHYQIKAERPIAQSLSVSTGSASAFVAAADAKWITVQPTGGRFTGTSAPEIVQISVDPDGMGAGTYTGGVRIDGTESGVDARRVSVTLEIADAPPATSPSSPADSTGNAPTTGSEATKNKVEPVKPDIRVTPPSLQFSMKAGGPLLATRTLDVSVVPRAEFSAVVTQGRWLGISGSRRQSKGTIQVTANAAGVTPGTYSDSVTISSSGVSKSVPVTLTVEAAPVAAPPPPPPPKKYPAFSWKEYGGAPSGVMRWTGELPPGGRLTIQIGSASTGAIRGQWEAGVPVTIDPVAPPAVIVQQPSEANDWRVVLENRSGASLNSIDLKWKVKMQ